MIAERSQALTQPAKAGLLAPKHLLRPPWSARGTRELSPTASRVNPFLLGVNPAPASLLERRTPSVVEPQSPPRGGRREGVVAPPLLHLAGGGKWGAASSDAGIHVKARRFRLPSSRAASAVRRTPRTEPCGGTGGGRICSQGLSPSSWNPGRWIPSNDRREQRGSRCISSLLLRDAATCPRER